MLIVPKYLICLIRGDGSTSDWIGPFNITEKCVVNHTWTKKGIFNARVKAKDETGLKSPWAIQEIETPYLKDSSYPQFLRIFARFRNILMTNIS